MAKSLKHLSQESLIHGMSQAVNEFTDFRQESKVIYPLHDVVMSGQAMMYFQDKSLLFFQKSLQEDQKINNLETLFKVVSIPKDAQMRNVLDDVQPKEFRPIFNDFFYRLQRGKHLEQYQLFDQSYLVVTDGSEFFSSKQIECSCCLKKEHKKGETTYHHQILQGAMVHPNLRQVIPFMPEQICNSDGQEKQDCEFNAGKRFIKDLRQEHPQLKITIGGDGLSSKQPYIELLRENRMNYVLVAKPDDHIKMMEAIDLCALAGEMNSLSIIDDKDRRHFYQWVNDIPLNGKDDTVRVNYFSYEMLVPDDEGNEKINYKNSWVTDFVVDKKNVVELVKIGRARWKIENECFNTLKNQGYFIDHNYGHGAKNLSFNFLILTELAFFMHQIAELTDSLFKECRAKLGSKHALWEFVRSSIKIFVFESWEFLFSFILNPKAFNPTIIRISD
jgi:hypothetical protein